jgi:nuclear transcription factor Y, gamma
MKSDEDVKMISAEAPILFAKGCDIFITELTMRAWIHAEESKRRTLQRSDIAQAISKSDMFDFLIDIVPREVANQHSAAIPPAQAFEYGKRGEESGPPGASPGGNAPGAFPLGYQDHAQGGVNYQSGPLGYTATPPGTSAGQGGQAYPHHPGHPLYDGNRYDPMYYSGQPVISFGGEADLGTP